MRGSAGATDRASALRSSSELRRPGPWMVGFGISVECLPDERERDHAQRDARGPARDATDAHRPALA